MELNKIAAAILVAGLVGMVAGKVSSMLYYGADAGHSSHQEVKRGYEIAGAEEEATGGGAPAEKELANIATLLQTADAKAGGVYFMKKCTTCHSGEKGGADKTGPHLWGIHNRAVGSAAGFGYSKAMAAHGGNWDYDALNHFLYKPKKYVAGTIMAFPGIDKDQDRANVVAYLRELSDAPAALPAAPAPVEEAPAAEAAPADNSAKPASDTTTPPAEESKKE